MTDRYGSADVDRRPPVLVGVLAVVVIVPLVVATRGGSIDAPFVGHHWRLTAIEDRLGRIVVPAEKAAWIEFGSDSRIKVDDTLNYGEGKYDVTWGGYRIKSIGMTAVGLMPRPARDLRRRVVFGTDTVVDMQRVSVRVVAGRLVLRSGSGPSLTFAR